MKKTIKNIMMYTKYSGSNKFGKNVWYAMINPPIDHGYLMRGSHNAQLLNKQAVRSFMKNLKRYYILKIIISDNDPLKINKVFCNQVIEFSAICEDMYIHKCVYEAMIYFYNPKD